MPNVVDKRIQQLPDQLANQIAAGEVVERPASVVKELLENSLDAGASQVEIDIEQGGLRRIRIHDNGCGIHAEDLPLALSRHATSKLANLHDLEHITSLGFRGEALPSIASVSRLQIITRRADAGQASRIEVSENGDASDVLPAAHPVGTTVIVEDLFCNAPARRRFQRAPRTEFAHIQDVVQRVALASPATAILLRHNGRQVLRLGAASDSATRHERIGRVFGKEFVSEAIPLNAEADGLRLGGYVAPPALHRAQSDRQYVYINTRMVRDKVLSHAIRQAYGDSLPEGRYAAYVLYLEIDPARVDVNVHPTKHEVRFRDGRSVHDFLFSAVQRGLQGQDDAMATHEYANTTHNVSAVQSPYSTPVREKATVYAMPLREARPLAETRPLPFGEVISCIDGRFILCRDSDRHVIVDARALLQQGYRQGLHAVLAEGAVASRPLLVPERVRLPAGQHDVIEQQHARLERFGFELTASGEHSALLRRAPVVLQQADQAAVAETLVKLIADELQDVDVIKALAETAARHTTLAGNVRSLSTWLAGQVGEELLASQQAWLKELDQAALAALFPTMDDH